MLPLGLFLIGLAATDSSPPAAIADPALASDPVIKIWINNNRQFREGERARVQVETRDDGYLVVMNYDTEGRLRILFPIDPRDDNFVRGGHRYEIRGRADRESFVTTRSGDGVVYAAVSADPIRFDDVAVGGTWDLGRLAVRDSRDPEADITDLLQRMVSNRGFDYDVLEYQVYGYNDYRVYGAGGRWYPRSYGYWDDFYCDWWWRPSLFGCHSYYSPFGYYAGYSPYGYGYGYGYGFGFGFNNWYNPYRYTYYYNNPNRRWPVVVGRPRGYTIVHRPIGSNSYGGGRTGTFSGSLPRGRDEGTVYRPRGGDNRGRPSGDRVGPSSSRPSNSNAARPRGRRSGGGDFESPTVERERPNGRPQVTFDEPRRRELNSDNDRGSVSRPEARPNIEMRPRDDQSVQVPLGRRSGGNDESRERFVPRGNDGDRNRYVPRDNDRPRNDGPRVEAPRNIDRPRYDPPARRDPPARAEPRSAPRGDAGSRPRGRPGS